MDSALPRLVAYWQGGLCKCGHAKNGGHWLCIDCWEAIHTTSEWLEVREACLKHVAAINNVLAVVEKRKLGLEER